MSISVAHLTVRRQGRIILDDVNFDIHAGSFAVLLGRNGSGKSTLFHALLGMVPAERGTMHGAGHDLARLSPRQRARILGYLPQFHRPVFPFRVMDVVLTGRAGHTRFLPRAADLAIAEQAMAQAGVASLRDRIYTELSGGEQQMVRIARLLAQAPQVVLMDEPTSHLDLHHQARLLALIRQMTAQGITVFAIVHDPNIALNEADQVLVLAGGTLTCVPPQAVDVTMLERSLGAQLCIVEDASRRVVTFQTGTM